jgi:hypothetical protein
LPSLFGHNVEGRTVALAHQGRVLELAESTDKVLQILDHESGCTTETELACLIEQVKKRSDAVSDLLHFQALNADLDADAVCQITWQRQVFASMGVQVDDDEIHSFYLSTRALEPKKILLVLKNICAQIQQFRELAAGDFSYADWQSVQELERNFLEFGLTFSNAELFELYQADSAEVFSLFRAKIHSGMAKMLEVLSRQDDQIPEWLQAILQAEPGAERIIQVETEERQTYKQLLMTFFDSLGLSNRRYLVEQVLDSWSH